MILGQVTIAVLEKPNPSDAREREANSTKKFETHTLVRGKLHLFDWICSLRSIGRIKKALRGMLIVDELQSRLRLQVNE